MRTVKIEKDESIVKCESCGTIIIYKEEDKIKSHTYGGDRIKVITCPKCGRKIVVE